MSKNKKLRIIVMDEESILVDVGCQLLNHREKEAVELMNDTPSLRIKAVRYGFKAVIKGGHRSQKAAWEITIGIKSLDLGTPILLSTSSG